jgi:hypothetical protein
LVQDLRYDRQQEMVFQFWLPVDGADAITALHINYSIRFAMVADGKNTIGYLFIRGNFRIIYSDYLYCAFDQSAY